MAKVFASEIMPNQEVASWFVVTDQQLRVARNGTPFLTLKLSDKTGEVVGRVWERAEDVAESLTPRSVVFLRGRSEKYKDELQLNIQEVSVVPVSQVDPADFLPVCPLDIEIMYEKLKKLATGIKRRSLHQLMSHILGDKGFVERFKRAPAAKSMHHAYLGGLLEHTVSVASLVGLICRQYPDLDRDLLLVGAVVHDMGKVDEFTYDLSIDYSHAGRLMGHIMLGVQMVEEKIRAMKSFPQEDGLLVKHLILSHHGQADLGAVKVPMTREAFVLHFADDLDAKMNCLTRILAESKGPDEAWTSYQPLFERFFFKGFPQTEENGAPPTTTVSPEDDQAVQLKLWPSGKKNKEQG